MGYKYAIMADGEKNVCFQNVCSLCGIPEEIGRPCGGLNIVNEDQFIADLREAIQHPEIGEEVEAFAARIKFNYSACPGMIITQPCTRHCEDSAEPWKCDGCGHLKANNTICGDAVYHPKYREFIATLDTFLRNSEPDELYPGIFTFIIIGHDYLRAKYLQACGSTEFTLCSN